VPLLDATRSCQSTTRRAPPAAINDVFRRRFFTATLQAALFGAVISCGAGQDFTGPTPLSGIWISPRTWSLVPGATFQFTAEFRGAGDQIIAPRAVSWSSSDPGKVTVSATGVVRGIAPGSASITATADGLSGTAHVTVEEGGVATPAGTVIVAQGAAVSLTIPNGALDAETPIVVATATSIPADPRLVPGTAFTISPPTASFAKPVILTLSYATANVAASMPANQLAVYQLVEGAWTPANAVAPTSAQFNASAGNGDAVRTVSAA